MYSINDLKLGTVITHNGQPYVVMAAAHNKQGRGGANLKTKLKNLITASTLEITYSGGDRIEEANLERSKANFLYNQGDEYFFMDNDTYEQFSLDKKILGDPADFLKEGTAVEVLVYEGKPVSVKLPVKVDLRVIESPPGIKGDTAKSGTKSAQIETGASIQVPLFINSGDRIKVDTRTGGYIERA